MALRYRDRAHKSPAPGQKLPAFIVSEYASGDLLLYSHGRFDIWCVYHAIRTNDNGQHSSFKENYPLALRTIRVKEMTGTQTDFMGLLLPSETIECDPEATCYRFDAPEDVDYMQGMRALAKKYGRDRVWNSFISVYDSIPQVREIGITRDMTNKVMDVASTYPEEKGLRLTLDCLLCAMVAENNRLRKYGSRYDTKLGKKIKALGVYQAVYETDLSIRQVADYSKLRDWRCVSQECGKRGILTPDL